MSVLKYWDTGTSSWQVAIVGAEGATGPAGATGVGVDGATGLTGATGTAGSGDYLITLPNSLNFDTTVPIQQINQANVQTSTWGHNANIVPSSSGFITNYGVGGILNPIIWDATRFRILATTYGTAVQCWGSSFYSISGAMAVKMVLSFIST